MDNTPLTSGMTRRRRRRGAGIGGGQGRVRKKGLERMKDSQPLPGPRVTNRANDNLEYKKFKAYANLTFANELSAQSALDWELYRRAIDLMCADLHRLDLWSLPLVKEYWRNKSPLPSALCQ